MALLVPTLAQQLVGCESWRESDVLIVGRSFCREHTPLWLPRVDARGEGTGITGMEFPLVNWVQGKVLCAGDDQVVGAQLLTLIRALVGATCLWALARDALGRRAALLGQCTFLLSPLVFYYGRSTMPDVPALCFGLLGLFLLRRALALDRSAFESCRPRSVLAFAGWIAWLTAVLTPSLVWYAHARRLQEQGGLNTFNLARSGDEMFADVMRLHFYKLLLVQHPFDVYAFPAVTALAMGYALWPRGRLPRWVIGPGLGVLAYFLLLGYPAVHHV